MPKATTVSSSDDSPVIMHPPGIEGVELMRARYVRQDFPRHFHNRYGVGVIEDGAMEFSFLGRMHVAGAGNVNLTVPGEVHDGHAYVEKGWTYRMFYLDPELVQDAASQAAGHPVALPDFSTGVLEDPELAGVIRATHTLLMNPDASLLARQSQLLAMLALWTSRHSEARPPLPGAKREPKAVALTKAYMDEHCGEEISLADLARLANLSQFHFTRAFTAAVGMPPHAYLICARIRLGRKLLATPMRLADIAAETGFTDQAHFTHVFKRFTGLTPGRYRKFLQT